MEALRIQGGPALRGSVAAQGSKNSALVIMASSLICDTPVTLRDVPAVTDVATLSAVLRTLGMQIETPQPDIMRLQVVDRVPIRAAYPLVSQMRASFCVLGPLLARRGRAVVALPGGCDLGHRPVDLHLTGLAALGAEIEIRSGYVLATASRLRGATIDLTGLNGPTVTGTANVMMAAALARGSTVIRGAACEPEVEDLGRFLVSCGARIEGLGTSTIHIEGVDELGFSEEPDADYRVGADRIEVATLLIAAAITGGRVTVTDAEPRHQHATLQILQQAGCCVDIERTRDDRAAITLTAPARVKPFRCVAAPYPHLPSDVQPLLAALAATAGGESVIEDRVFTERWHYAAELTRLAADVRVRQGVARVRGGSRLSGAPVRAPDLRAAAALVLAGLVAEGETHVGQIGHLLRGYADLPGKLQSLGANIQPVAGKTAVRPRLNGGTPVSSRRILATKRANYRPRKTR